MEKKEMKEAIENGICPNCEMSSLDIVGGGNRGTLVYCTECDWHEPVEEDVCPNCGYHTVALIVLDDESSRKFCGRCDWLAL